MLIGLAHEYEPLRLDNLLGNLHNHKHTTYVLSTPHTQQRPARCTPLLENAHREDCNLMCLAPHTINLSIPNRPSRHSYTRTTAVKTSRYFLAPLRSRETLTVYLHPTPVQPSFATTPVHSRRSTVTTLHLPIHSSCYCFFYLLLVKGTTMRMLTVHMYILFSPKRFPPIIPQSPPLALPHPPRVAAHHPSSCA